MMLWLNEGAHTALSWCEKQNKHWATSASHDVSCWWPTGPCLQRQACRPRMNSRVFSDANPPGSVPVYTSFSAFSAPFIWYVPTCIIQFSPAMVLRARFQTSWASFVWEKCFIAFLVFFSFSNWIPPQKRPETCNTALLQMNKSGFFLFDSWHSNRKYG